MFSDWFDRPSSRKLLWKLLWIACALTLFAQLVYHFLPVEHPKHHFAAQDYLFFYAALGFVACALSILAAKWIGYILKKPESYYGDKDEPLPDTEPGSKS